ncbi:MAG: hypothetical protein QOJ81_1503 [Chloroflexota bacterium]|nr:hypothetical protein [Chloroflexota bacterium]
MRAARLTDLAAVSELSRLSHAEVAGTGRMRTLGLPVSSGQISVFSLFRLPLGAFLPGDLLYVYEDRGHVDGLARVEHEGMRDEFTIVELDAVDDGAAGDIRFRLVQHILRDASKRVGLRFHVACADEAGNVELFMQAGFARYGEERLFYRPPDESISSQMSASDAAQRGIRAAQAVDALELDRLYRAATPAPVVRLEDYRLPDWERQGNHWRVPRSALTPLLRFADVEAFVQGSAKDQTLLAFCQVGRAKAEQPDYLRIISRPEHDPSDLIAFGLTQIKLHRSGRGVVSAVRTYESPLDRRLAENGFGSLAVVSLLMREVTQRVKEPALVPVGIR